MSDIAEFRDEQTERIVEVLKGIAHPLRFKIVVLLCHGDRAVSEMVDLLGARQSLISQHLGTLRLTGLVEVSKSSGRYRYRLKEPVISELISCLNSCRTR